MFGSDSQNLFKNTQNNKHGGQHQMTYINNIESDNTFAGVIPRAIYSLFQLTSQEPFKNRKFALYCSFLQIYNEKIFDLLLVTFIIFLLNNALQDSQKPLQIHENKVDGIYVGNY